MGYSIAFRIFSVYPERMSELVNRDEEPTIVPRSSRVTALWIMGGVGTLGLGFCFSTVLVRDPAEGGLDSFDVLTAAFGLFLALAIGGLSFVAWKNLALARSFSQVQLGELIMIPVLAGFSISLWTALDIDWHALAVAALFSVVLLWACMDSNRITVPSTRLRILHAASSAGIALGLMMWCVYLLIIFWLLYRHRRLDLSNSEWESLLNFTFVVPLNKMRWDERALAGPVRICTYLFVIGGIGMRICKNLISRHSTAKGDSA